MGNYTYTSIPGARTLTEKQAPAPFSATLGPVEATKTDRALAPLPGLTSHSVQIVAVDPFTGKPIIASGQGNTVSAQNANDVIVNRPAPVVTSPHVINAADPLDATRLGLTSPARPAPAVTAIEAATAPADPPWGPGPRPRPFAAPLFGTMPAPNGVAVPDDGGIYGIPAQGFATKPNAGVSAALLARNAGVPGAPTGNPAVQNAMVQIASGRTVPVGATGTAQGGTYSYTVQPDGSIAKTRAATLPPAVAAERQQQQQDTIAQHARSAFY